MAFVEHNYPLGGTALGTLFTRPLQVEIRPPPDFAPQPRERVSPLLCQSSKTQLVITLRFSSSPGDVHSTAGSQMRYTSPSNTAHMKLACMYVSKYVRC